MYHNINDLCSKIDVIKEKADELGVYMPLVNGLYKIIYQNDSIKNIISSLMLSEQSLDVEFAANEEKILMHGEKT